MRKHFALKYLLLGGLIGATTVTALAADAEVQGKDRVCHKKKYGEKPFALRGGTVRISS